MTDLKRENASQLRLQLLIAVVPIYITIIYNYEKAFFTFDNLLSKAAIAQFATLGLGPLVCLGVVLVLLSNVVSPDWKARLVFCRWNDPLPASRADQLMMKDTRLDLEILDPATQHLLSEDMTPKQRNSYWYKHIFVDVRDIAAVKNAHRQYLLNRDAATGVALLTLITFLCDMTVRVFQEVHILSVYTYIILIVYTLLLMFTSATGGKRMVTNAIANYPLKKDGNS